MICPKCGHEQPDGGLECGRCRVVFAKYERMAARRGASGGALSVSAPVPPAGAAPEEETQSLGGWLWERTLFIDAPVNPFFWGGRMVLFLILLIWGLYFFFQPFANGMAMQSVLHLVHLPLHEAGHVFFGFFGRFIGVMGGALGQTLMPLAFVLSFLWKHNPFAAAVCLWWLGHSFMDLAPYIADARALELPLLGGVTGRDVPDYHDFEYLLGRLGWLKYDQVLGHLAEKTGMLLMTAAFVWGGILLYHQYQQRDHEPWGHKD
jgi:hypothetical protein